MTPIDIRCYTNEEMLEVDTTDAGGNQRIFLIDPQMALIDESGLIRSFTRTWKGGEGTYVLHPYSKPTNPAVYWIGEFLSSFGLSRARGQIVKVPKGTNPVLGEAIQLGSYLIFSVGAGYVIKSFMASHYRGTKIGYHDVKTDNLVYSKPIYVK